MLIPSIDIANGKAVQLRQGTELVVTSERDPRALAREFGRVGEVAVVDLDAAMGMGDNLALIEELCRLAACRVGGGIRDLERAKRLLKAGARKLIIGTKAEPEFLEQLPLGRVMVALDARNDRVVSEGWTAESDEAPVARARRLERYVSGFLYTIVEREGTEGGIDVDRVRKVAESVSVPVTAAGGITTVDEVTRLDAMGVDAQVGMAIYTGKLRPAECLAATVDFEKTGGSVPTIVQDARDGRILLVARSTAETLMEAVETGDTILFSRRRGRWRKGETSGNTQELVRVEVDCDRDTLLFQVVPAGPACHTGAPSCFGERPFSLAALEEVLRERAGSSDASSYTRKLLDDPIERRAKLLEEVNELVEAGGREAIRWEAADVIYHMLVHLRAAGVTMQDVLWELEARRR